MVIFLQSDPEFSQEEEESLAEKEGLFEEALLEYEDMISNAEEQEIYANIRNLYDHDFAERKQNVRDAVASGDAAAMASAIQAIDDMGSDISNYFDEANALNDELASEKIAANQALSRSSTVLLVIAMVLGAALAVIFAFIISALVAKPLRSISGALDFFASTGCLELSADLSQQIKETSQRQDELGTVARDYQDMMKRFSYLSAELDKIADGDLTAEIELASPKDAMGKSLRTMIGHLNSIFKGINDATALVSTGAQQVAETAVSISSSAEHMAAGAQSLAAGATEQASSIESVSGSMATIAEKTRINADTADQAVKLADTIIHKADKGNHQMDEMVTAVKNINEASQSVSNIMDTISGIAEQTNLLALNAAIEAARAGEHGKGFAVVADEVRTLAAQSEEAVQETSSIIQDSVKKAELGVRIAEDMAASLTEMVAGINDSSRLIMEIAKASEEQSVSIAQINTSIDQVANIVQHNSELSQESAAASEETAAASEESAALAEKMSTQSDVLKSLIARVNVD
jgi:methyl-accepting chemotaxis protein